MTSDVKVEARIKAIALAGGGFPELAIELTEYADASLKSWLSEVRGRFTPEERAQAQKAKSNRPKKSSFYQTPLSEDHWRIGAKLSLFFIRTHITPVAFKNTYHLCTPHTLSKMTSGIHDFKLSEMIKIAKMLDITLEELTRPLSQSDDTAAIDCGTEIADTAGVTVAD